jgi:hypothetical protein
MKKDLVMKRSDFSSTFLTCEQDCDLILRKLFVESRPYCDDLKRLLVINAKDCLDNTTSKVYKEAIADATLPKLLDEGYIRLSPKIAMQEHEEVKSYILITFDNFAPTSNPQYKDCTVSFDILCHTDQWDLGGCRIRPLKIAGYIDGILNNTKLSGIGTFQFIGCSMVVLDETLSGYTLIYRAIHDMKDTEELDHIKRG